jgi:hypothetical protein
MPRDIRPGAGHALHAIMRHHASHWSCLSLISHIINLQTQHQARMQALLTTSTDKTDASAVRHDHSSNTLILIQFHFIFAIPNSQMHLIASVHLFSAASSKNATATSHRRREGGASSDSSSSDSSNRDSSSPTASSDEKSESSDEESDPSLHASSGGNVLDEEPLFSHSGTKIPRFE